MTVSLKAFRADVKGILNHMGRCESFRTTGDCTARNHSEADA